MRANLYRIIEHAVETGIAFGLRRARKYAVGALTDGAIEEHITRETMNALHDFLEFDDPTAADDAIAGIRAKTASARMDLREVERELEAARRELAEARVERDLATDALDWQPTDTDGVEAASCMTDDGAPFYWRIERDTNGHWTNVASAHELARRPFVTSTNLNEVKAECQRIEDAIARLAEVGP